MVGVRSQSLLLQVSCVSFGVCLLRLALASNLASQSFLPAARDHSVRRSVATTTLPVAWLSTAKKNRILYF